jgi:hypothetical protein
MFPADSTVSKIPVRYTFKDSSQLKGSIALRLGFLFGCPGRGVLSKNTFGPDCFLYLFDYIDDRGFHEIFADLISNNSLDAPTKKTLDSIK